MEHFSSNNGSPDQSDIRFGSASPEPKSPFSLEGNEQFEDEASLDVNLETIESVERREREIMVASCVSFTELFDVLDKIGVIPGKSKQYSSVEIKEIIEDVREGKLDPFYVTKEFKIRNKVIELLEFENREKMFKDHLQDNNSKYIH